MDAMSRGRPAAQSTDYLDEAFLASLNEALEGAAKANAAMRRGLETQSDNIESEYSRRRSCHRKLQRQQILGYVSAGATGLLTAAIVIGSVYLLRR